MKRILKALIAIILICTYTFFPLIYGFDNINLSEKPRVVKAESIKYARILEENTPLYSDFSLTTIKFNLPYSYFVKVLSETDKAVKVLYMDDEQQSPMQEGFIKSEQLFPFDGIPENPYPKVFLSLKCDEILFSDTNKNYPKTVLPASTTAIYYGSIVNGENFYYVYAGGYIGYVRKNSFVSTVIPNHPLEIKNDDELSSESTEELNSVTPTPEIENPQISNQNNTIKLVAIIAISVIGISIIYILLRQGKPIVKTAVTKDSDDDF